MFLQPLFLATSIQEHVPAYRDFFEWSTFRPAFLKRGDRFIVGTDLTKPGGLPVEAFQRLYFVHKGQRILVQGFSDLENKVSLSSAENALSYLRVLTSPKTAYMYRIGVEEVSSNHITADVLLGDKALLKMLRDVPLGRGIVHKEVSPVQVEETAKGFVVTRWLLTKEGNDVFEEHLRELVSFTGRVTTDTLSKIVAPPDSDEFFAATLGFK
jgi:hypothetical protein